jgi:hypothetical protein
MITGTNWFLFAIGKFCSQWIEPLTSPLHSIPRGGRVIQTFFFFFLKFKNKSGGGLEIVTSAS